MEEEEKPVTLAHRNLYLVMYKKTTYVNHYIIMFGQDISILCLYRDQQSDQII
jgi:hypothetical protein